MKIKLFIVAGLIVSFVFCLAGCKPAKRKKIEKQKPAVTVKKPEPQKAITKYYEKILQREPKTTQDYMSVGFAHYYFGRIKEARENYEKARELYQTQGDQESVREVEGYLNLLKQQKR